MNYFRKKRVTLPQHFLRMTNMFSEIITEKSIKSNVYSLKFKIKPFENSNEYEILFFHEKNSVPKTYVINPNIYELSCGKKPPHTYEFNEKVCRLCLNLPEELDTNEHYDYVIPWISDWLGYFEIWLITDEWYGGGHSYDDSKKD